MGKYNQFSAENNNTADNTTQGMRDYLLADKLNVFIVGPLSLHITLNNHKTWSTPLHKNCLVFLL